MFIRDSTCLVLLWILSCQLFFHILDFHRLWYAFPNISIRIAKSIIQSITPDVLLLLVQAPPISLATTLGIEFSFFSCDYLDVSVHHVHLNMLLYLHIDNQPFMLAEFPHSDIYGLQDICSSPQLFAAYHVLHRLLVPRHSPYALSSLTFKILKNFVLLR